MKKQLFKDLSVNSLQVLANQVLGTGIFLLISLYLDKPVFGELSWSLAVLTFATTILSLGLDQIVVRNIAAGKDAASMLRLFATHNLVTGLIFFGVLSAGHFLYPVFFDRHSPLWILSISQLLSFFSQPFRQLVTGRSAFGWLAVLSTVSNLVRAGWLFGLVLFSTLTLRWVLIVFTVSSLLEYLSGAYIVTRRLHIPFRLRGRITDYTTLIRESLPQVGMVFLQAGIARTDWILLGIFCTAARTAEYSFAYRAYELSPLPLIILAPLLLNRLARWAGSSSAGPDGLNFPWLNGLVRAEMTLATLLPLLLNIAWIPVMDRLTHHKYGQSNAAVFLILSCCIPFQYLTNLLWSLAFARNRLSLILAITAVMAAIVLTGDLLLIPRYAGYGAALTFLTAMIVQYGLFHRYSPFPHKRQWARQLLIAIGIAVCSGLPALRITPFLIPRLLLATGIYSVLALITGQVRVGDWAVPKKILYHEP